MAATSSLSATLNDPARLAALDATRLLDSAPEPEFDRLAQRLLDVPTALVSLVDERRQFFKSCVGMTGWAAEARGTPLSYSFGKHVVHSGAPLAITDARDVPLLRVIRAAEPDSTRIPIIAVTGHVLDDDRDRCRRAGMDDHLAKPIDPGALDAIVARWLPGA